MKSLHLQIDRIVVEGLPESGQRRFMRALEAELHQLAKSGVADSFNRNTRKRIQALNAGQLRPGATPEQAAAQVARSIRQTVFPSEQVARSTRENAPRLATRQADSQIENPAATARTSIASSPQVTISGKEARTHV